MREATLSTCLPANIQKHWTSRLVVGRIEEVTLLECVLCVRLIAAGVLKVINLLMVRESTDEKEGLCQYWLINGMSSVSWRSRSFLMPLERSRCCGANGGESVEQRGDLHHANRGSNAAKSEIKRVAHGF